MKRSAPLRSDPEKARAWKRRGKPLAAVGAVRKRKRKAMAAHEAAVWERDGGRCRFPHLKVWTDGSPLPCWGALEVHHPVARGVDPSMDTDPHNGILLCWRSHAWIQEDIPAARRLGLYGSAGAKVHNGLVVR